MSRVPVPESGMSPTPPIARSPRNKAKAHALGLTSATGLVVGRVVGTGVFTMPAVLAGADTMGIVVLAVIAVGAMLLAALFGQLTERIPHSDDGLYAYARHEFGDFTGYLVGWSYWISAWAGNAARGRIVGVLRGRLDRSEKPEQPRELGYRPGGVVGAGDREPGRGSPDGVVSERHGGVEVPAVAVRRRRRLVLCREGPLRALQRVRRQPVRRDRDRRRGGAVLLHRRGGGCDHRQAGDARAGTSVGRR